MITYNIKINPVKCRTSHSNIVLTTGDVKGYVFKFAFEQTIPDYSFITLKAKRADGRIITAGAECAEIVLPSDMYCVPGEIVFEVAICGEDGSCVTVHVLTALVREGFGDSGTEGDDRFPVLTTLIKGVTESKAFFDSFRDENGNLKGDCFANGSIAEEKLTEKLVKKINIQPDWNEPDCTSVSYINNKPDLTLKENKANKVTAITGNETAEKYPNVHAVINYLQSHGMTEAQAVECIKEYFKYNSAYMHEVIAGILLTTPAINVGYAENWGSVLRISQSGNATSLQADLDTKSSEMRLLNSYIFDKEAVSVDFTHTDDGVAYKDIPLKKVFIHTFTKTYGMSITSSTYTDFYFGIEGQSTKNLGKGCGQASIGQTDTDGIHGFCFLDFDKRLHLQSGGGAKGGYDTTAKFGATLAYKSSSLGSILGNDNIINRIMWQSTNSAVLFPVGSKIEIWGCA